MLVAAIANHVRGSGGLLMNPICRRKFLGKLLSGGAAAYTSSSLAHHLQNNTSGPGRWVKRLTGADLYTNSQWNVAGTDLGIPYILENGSIGYLFGDTFSTAWPADEVDQRSPVMLRSNIHPNATNGIVFDSAAKVAGNGRAPQIMPNGLGGPDHNGINEVTVIPNDGVSFWWNGHQVVSYMSIDYWNHGAEVAWKTNYAGLAISTNGNDFTRGSIMWANDNNEDPFQMWTMQYHRGWVYIFSVRAGRQYGPMMLQAVQPQHMFDKSKYIGWGWNGRNWGWNRPCTAILTGKFGEPSVRRLFDGTWVMSYLNLDTLSIVTRTATGPNRVWSAEKTQVTWEQEPALYGGFIHPWSTSGPNGLHLLVSTWQRRIAYHVSQYRGSV